MENDSIQQEGILSPKAEKIWNLKYARTKADGSKESWEEGCWRIAYHVAGAEREYGKSEEEIIELAKDYYRMMVNLLFIPGGRILANAGTNIKNMFNCFVVPVDDSRAGIYKALGTSAEIFAHGGGVGYNFSHIRERGASIKSTGGKASGPLSFMELFDHTGEVIQQASRRGAQMGILNIDHPDIENFIDYKANLTDKNKRIVDEFSLSAKGDYLQVDGKWYHASVLEHILTDNQLTHFNISVGISNDFMQAVKEDKEWNLISRVDGSAVKTLSARALMNKIAESAWRSGDPGVIFLDRMEEDNMVPYLGKLEATNPCFVYDTQILTSYGYRKIGDLADSEYGADLINADGNKAHCRVWFSGNKDIVKLRFSDGKTIRCTPNHVFKTVSGDEIAAEDSKGVQFLPYLNYPDYLLGLYVLYGFIQGDGSLGRLKSDVHKGLEVYIGENDQEILAMLDRFKVQFTDVNSKESCYYVQGLNDKLNILGFDSRSLPEREFPTTYSSWDKFPKAEFLQGCFSANGSIVGERGRVTYKSTSKKFIEQLQKTLIEDFGIDSYITTNKPQLIEFNNGKYTTRVSYDLNIGRHSERVKFFNQINFVQQYKIEKLKKYILETAPYVSSIKQDGKADVYDFNEPLTNWGVIEGIVAHNCSEVTLLPNEPCCLGSINLALMVEDGQVSEKKLAWVTTMATRFLDDVHTINNTPIEEVNQAAKATRRLGLGVMGWADLLVKVGLPYDSEEAIALAEEIMKSISTVAWGTSQFLAEERGTFEAFNKEQVINIAPWILNNGDSVRNVAVTSIAPTGSIALLADVNSGIEPFFALTYTRYITEGVGNVIKDKIVEVNPHLEKYFRNKIHNFEKDGYRFIPNDVLEELDKKLEFIKSSDALPKSVDEEDRNIFKTANEISWEAHINMQAAFQKYTDNAISKTINMPNSATVEDVMEAYIYAWEKGLKSIALYRDGSKNFQVLNK